MKKGVQTGNMIQRGAKMDYLTPDEVQDAHNAGLEILERTGIYVEHAEALEIFHSIGCVVDKAKKNVRIPSFLVEEALRSAPSQFIISGRDKSKSILIGGRRVCYQSFGEAVRVNDPYTGKQRDSGKMDMAASTRVVDGADEIDIIMSSLASQDTSTESYLLHGFEAMIHNTVKPFFICAGNKRVVDKMMEIATMVRGDGEPLSMAPFMSLVSCVVSPLKLVNEFCECAIAGARHGIPMTYSTCSLSGATAPITMMGSIALNNAEFMAACTLCQAVRKGTPCYRATSSHMMDMKSSETGVGTPEMAMQSGINAQMARFHGIPSRAAGT